MNYNIRLLILFSMVFCHIVDDYYLQGDLKEFKQKKWWAKHAPQKRYEKDYLMALFMHGFSWSFMVHMPLTIYSLMTGKIQYIVIAISCLCHAIVHAVVDDIKANQFSINLIQDQLIHLFQIAAILITVFIL